ncbi:MAG: tRNA-dihydrouridine synthase [Candidatus Saccharibacteria bacterium]
MNNIWQKLKKENEPFFVLAPMEDVTDTVFRQMVIKLSPPDLMVTEFVNADGYCSPGREAVGRRLRYTKKEQPLIAQIWGLNPVNYRQMAKDLVGMGFAGIDINMGCPVKDVVKKGACSAMILNHELAALVISETRAGILDAGGDIPLSVKTRIGYNEPDVTSWIGFLLKQNLDAITVHGRTRKQMSKVPADWQEIARAVKLRDKLSPQTVIVGNGDVMSRAQGESLAKMSGVDGVMIGRGIFHDPFIFSKTAKKADLKLMLKYLKQHIELHQKTWGGEKFEPLKKFIKMYISGFAGSSEIRAKLFAAKSHVDLIKMIDNIV